tara:strand:- start:132 stop:404 length:273 start_codon:yes stop_codon:yes gene_type:complete
MPYSSTSGTRKYGDNPLKAKQKLSPKAAAAKKRRDTAMAKTKRRTDMRSQAQSIGQRSDSDIHHTTGKAGPTKRVSVKNNRGNFGKGTRS